MKLNVPETSPTYYAIAGEITCSRFCVSKDLQNVNCTCKYSQVFYDRSLSDPIPEIMIGTTAFIIRITEDGKPDSRVVTSYVGLVQAVNIFAVNLAEDSVRFDMRVLRVERNRSSVTNVQPQITHIFAEGGFIAITLEGEREAVESYMNNELALFVHGDAYYHKAGTAQIAYKTQEDIDLGRDDTYIAGIYFGSVRAIPSTEKFEQFKSKAVNILGWYYNHILQRKPS